MHRSFIAKLSLLALITPVFSTLATPSQSGTILHPIKPADYEASMGIQRRASNDLSTMNPRNQTHLIYGSTKDTSQQLVLANLTLHAQDGLPIVALEHFEELTDQVDCRGDEGRLDLTFGSKDAFEYARMQWGFVNKGVEGRFLLVVNTEGCGGEGERQAYVVDSITDYAETRTTTLAAKAVAWSEVAGSYELSFGHTAPVPRADRLRRGLIDDAKNVGKDVGKDSTDVKHGEFNKSGSNSFNLSAGRPNERRNIVSDAEAGLVLDCVNCYLAGSVEYTGHLLVRNFELKNFYLTLVPRSFQAALQLEATASASREVGSHPFNVNLFHQAFPNAGISIKEVIDLGIMLDYFVGGDCTFSGAAVVDFGVNASVPDTAVIVLGYENGTSLATGLNSSSLTPIFDIDNASASVTLSAWSQPEISFGIDLHRVGRLDMNVTTRLPELTAKVIAVYDEDGACNHSAGALTTGVKIDNEASIDVDFGVIAKLGSHGASWSTNLLSFPKPLPPLCYPLSIPELLSSHGTTTVPGSPTVTKDGVVLNTSSSGPQSTSSSNMTTYTWTGWSNSTSSTMVTTIPTPIFNATSVDQTPTPLFQVVTGITLQPALRPILADVAGLVSDITTTTVASSSSMPSITTFFTTLSTLVNVGSGNQLTQVSYI